MPSTSLWARSPSAAQATPKNSENTTICRISLVAIASTIERGTRCATNSFIDNDATLRLVEASASGSGRLRLSPGLRMLTRIMPTRSDTSDAPMNQTIALPPMRPTDHERREHERRDDHFNEAQEDVGEQRDVVGDGLRRFRVGPQDVTGVTDENAHHHADKNNRGELRAHGLPPALCQSSSLAEKTPRKSRPMHCSGDRPHRYAKKLCLTRYRRRLKVVSFLAAGASATAASVVSSRKVNVSWR